MKQLIPALVLVVLYLIVGAMLIEFAQQIAAK